MQGSDTEGGIVLMLGIICSFQKAGQTYYTCKSCIAP